jgi:hypothetical protein
MQASTPSSPSWARRGSGSARVTTRCPRFSRALNSLVQVPPEVADMSVRDASLELAELDPQLAALKQ